MKVSNPTIEEIRLWANSDREWPHDEWDLFLSWKGEIDLYIELATDHSCAKSGFFLHMLYYMVGTTFSEPNQTDKLQRIKSYADKGRRINHGDIRLWVRNMDALLNGSQKYEYLNWRGGLHAKYKFA